MLITVTCNECGHEFEMSGDDERIEHGRTYCDEHSVMRPLYRSLCPIIGQPQPKCITIGPGPFFVTGVNHVCGR
jgi:PHP family Zn ribbon phosphoesterase